MSPRPIFCSAPLVLLAAITTPALAADIDTLRQRMVDELLQGNGGNGAAGVLNAMGSDGCFSDVDYAATSVATWAPITHLQRLRTLAIAYRTTGDAHFGAAATLTAVQKGLACWYAKKPTSTNWWWNDIGKEQQLGPIGLLMADALSSAQLKLIIDDFPTTPSLDGANRVWISEEVVQRGILEKNLDRVKTGLGGITESITLNAVSGLQEDGSFYQHGALLYNMGYGDAFLSDETRWATLTAGTGFAFSEAQLELISRLLLDGDRWMIRGHMSDESADGREISRPNQNDSSVAAAAARMLPLVPMHAAEYTAIQQHISGKGAPPILGNKHFWRSDFMTHPQARLYFSVKMSSKRTLGTESINGENGKGLWLPFGLTYLAITGDEYKDVFQVWDWGHLPGVTGPYISGTPVSHSSTFVGGVSNGAHGVAAMHLDVENTKAERAWFALGDVIVALGTGIVSTHAAAVHTTLNQAITKGAVESNVGAVTNGTSNIPAARWIYQDGIGYYFFTPTALNVKVGPQSGSWSAINTSGSTTTVTLNVFTAWIDHGKSPSAASYAYAIRAATSAIDLGQWAASPTVTVLHNDSTLQAVRHNGLGLTGVVFKAGGTIQSDKSQLKVDQPCLALMDDVNGTLSISNPEAAALTVNATVTAPSGHVQMLRFDLPGDIAMAGSTVTKAFEGGTGLIDAGTLLVPDADVAVPTGEAGTAAGGTGGMAGATAAGASATGGRATPDGGGLAADASVSSAKTPGGCSCRVTARRGSSSGAWLLLSVLGLLLIRRRSQLEEFIHDLVQNAMLKF